MALRDILRALVGILIPLLIVVLLWQGLVRPLPELLAQFGIDFRILSIGILLGTSYFFSRIVCIALFGRPYIPDLSGGLFVPRDSGDLNELWVLTSTIVFELGLASLLGFFFNRFGFFIGLVVGSLLGYQIGIYSLPLMQQLRIPWILRLAFSAITLFGSTAVLSLYLTVNLGSLHINLIIGLAIGLLCGFASMVITSVSKLGGLVSITCLSVLVLAYAL